MMGLLLPQHSVGSGNTGHDRLFKARETCSHNFPALGPSDTSRFTPLFLRGTSTFLSYCPTIIAVGLVLIVPDLSRLAQAYDRLLSFPFGIWLCSEETEAPVVVDQGVYISQDFPLAIALNGKGEMEKWNFPNL